MQVAEGLNAKRKKIIAKSAMVFMVVLLVLTFFSKTIYNFLLPDVECSKPIKGTLKKEVRVTGVITALNPQKFYSYGRLRITEVKVKAGDQVEQGDLLALADMDDIRIAFLKNSLELEKLEAELESYKKSFEEADVAINEKELKAAGRAVKEQEEKLSDIQTLYEAGAEPYAKLKEAQRSLDIVKEDYEDKLKELENKKAKTGKSKEEYNKTIKQKEMEIELRKLENKKSTGEIPEDGEIRAQAAGTVIKVNMEKGVYIDEGQLLLEMAYTDGDYAVKWMLDEKKAAFFKEGDSVEVSSGSTGKMVYEGSVTAMSYNPLEGRYEFLSAISDPDFPGALETGRKAEVLLYRDSGEYEIILPNNSIIRISEGKGFVFVLRQRSKALGDEKYVERVDVDILDSDDASTAVEGGLSTSDDVVVYSSSILQDDSKVRSDSN